MAAIRSVSGCRRFRCGFCEKRSERTDQVGGQGEHWLIDVRIEFLGLGVGIVDHLRLGVEVIYHLLCWVGHQLAQSGDMRDWKTVRRLLRTHSLVTTRLPLMDGRIIEVRKPSLPDTEQALVYRQLGIDWKHAAPARKFVMK